MFSEKEVSKQGSKVNLFKYFKGLGLSGTTNSTQSLIQCPTPHPLVNR